MDISDSIESAEPVYYFISFCRISTGFCLFLLGEFVDLLHLGGKLWGFQVTN